ncbi:MAG: hypothetical protein WD490_06415 [Opitutales bacterium]
MRQFHTAVIERQKEFTGNFESQPYEAAWASEAIFFIRVEKLRGEDSTLKAAVRLSADGVRWVDEGTCFPPITAEGDYFVRVSHFGGWLSLRGEVSGGFRLTIQLVLKE